MIRYYRLFDLLNRRGMKKSDLRTILSPNTIAKLSKGENVNTDVIDKICLYLNCQPENIMEVVDDGTEITDSSTIVYDITTSEEIYQGGDTFDVAVETHTIFRNKE